LCLLLII